MMRVLIAGLFSLIIISPTCYAQTAPSATSNLAKIGQNLPNDTDMYQRFVYDDAQTVGKGVALSLPVMPDAEIESWLTDRVVQIMTVTPTLYPSHKNKVIRFFTADGWEQLTQQWVQAQIPQLIPVQGYSMAAVVVDNVQMVAKGRQQKADVTLYRWIVDVPILLTYTGSTGEAQAYPLALRIGLTRIPMRDDGQLIAIDQWGIAPAKPSATPAKS